MKTPLFCQFFNGLFLPFMLLGLDADAAITLVNATATTEQPGETFPNENAYVISRAIDGDTTSNVFGWALYPNIGSAQSAVFQTSGTVVGNDWNFQMFFSHFATGHKIQQFRISATEDANPTVSSGATWTTLDPTAVTVNWGGGTPSYVINGDDSVRVSGILEPSSSFLADYAIRASSAASMNVTGFRMEVFPYDDDGNSFATVGFQSGGNNGNIALTEFTAVAAPEPTRALLTALGFVGLILRRRR
jgi:hypothetical protein